MKGDYSRRVITDFSDDIITKFRTTSIVLPTDAVDSTCSNFDRISRKYVHGSDRLIHKPRFQAETSISENGTIWTLSLQESICWEMNLNRAQPPSTNWSRAKPVERNHVAKKKPTQRKPVLCNMSHEIRDSIKWRAGITQVMMNEVTNKDHLITLNDPQFRKNLTPIGLMIS